MRFIHDERLIEKYPDNFTGLIAVKNIGANLAAATEKLKSEIPSVIDSNDMIEANQKWIDIFSKMGAKAKYKSSLVAACDFYKDNGRLYRINAIVDFYNHFGLRNMVPMGAYDMSKIIGDLKLTFADKGIEFIGIGGKDIQKTVDNEIIYRDDAGVLCRSWNLKDADRTKITDDAKDVLFMFDIIAESPESAKETFERFRNDFTEIFGLINSSALTGMSIASKAEL
jgi:DNA/RNA-binding domain of Phe-tRNA-synthetase-like protein